MERQNNLTVEFFDDKEHAERAFQEAIKLGYKPEDISILMSESSREQYYQDDAKIEPGESTKGLASGGTVGAAIGSSLGALVALGTNLALPGLGLILAGPLAGAGGVSGLLLGSLFGWSTQESFPKDYQQALAKGIIVLAVTESSDKPSLENVWKPYKSKSDIH